MAKKKYRISKPNLMGGSVNSNEEVQNMAIGGETLENNQQIQAIMKTIYDLFKQGMTKMDIESSLLGQGMPYEFITQSINVVEKYMISTGEYEPEEEEPSPLSNGLPSENVKPPSQLSQQQDAQMQSYEEQSMDAAMSDEGEEESDELMYRENPYMQMGGFNPMQQQEAPQQQPESKEPSLTPYYSNIELYGGGVEDEASKMSRGGKVSKKQFMKNVLKRFEPGGANEEVSLSAAPKKDNLDKDVEKATKGFVSAVQGKAKESVAKEMHKLVEQSGDPKLQQMLMSGNQQQQPMQPMANEGMMVNGGDDDLIRNQSNKAAVKRINEQNKAELDILQPKIIAKHDDSLSQYTQPYYESPYDPTLDVTAEDAYNWNYKDNYDAAPSHEAAQRWKNVPQYNLMLARDPMFSNPKQTYINYSRKNNEKRGDIPYEYGGMQYADVGAVVDPGGQTYQEYIDWYNTEDPNNPPFDPATESKAPPMSEEEFNAAYGESTETDVYGRTVYRDKYVPSSQNYGYGYGIRDMLFPANRFMGYRPKYHVDPRLGKPVARDVYGKTLFGGKKYIDYYEMPDGDFDPEILRRSDINKRARQGNRFLRKALKGKLDYKDILNKTSTRRGNLDDAGNDMGVDPKKPSRRERDKQGLFASDPTWDEESWKDYGKKGQRQALQDYRFDKEDYNMRHRLSPNYEIYNTKERPRIEGFKNKVRGAIQKINPFKEIGGESYGEGGQYYYGPGGANSYAEQVLGLPDPTITPPFLQSAPTSLSYDYGNNPLSNNPMRGASSVADNSITNTSGNVSGVAMTSDGTYEEPGGNLDLDPDASLDPNSEENKRKLIGIKNRDKIGIRDGKPFNAVTNWLGERGVGMVNKYKADKQEASYMAQDQNMKKEGQFFKDKGDYDIYGNLRPNEEGFIGSTNNPGMTGSRVQKGGIAKGEVREMTLAEIQAFMDAGGKLEFL